MSTEPKVKKPLHHFPAPEWTGVSAALAAALAHEIRNPLLSIKGAAQLLEQAVAEADDKTLATLIITEARRIEQLVATLDPLTPNPAETSAPLNIHEITEYVRLAARTFASNVTIATDYDPSLPLVMGRREGLIQAVINLVKNAGEASSTTVTLSTRYLVGERMQRTGGGRLPIKLSVADNGPGVPEAMLARLFTPFHSGKADGRGLGLAIVAKIAEDHGGLVAYEGMAGRGAVFSLYLPAA